MNTQRIIHWLAIAGLGYYVVKAVIFERLGTSLGNSIAIGVWSFLTWMLMQRPKKSGLGVGAFLLFAIAVQTGLWRLALTSPRKEELAIDPSWLAFSLSVLPLLIAGISSISLHWIYTEKPDDAHIHTTSED